VTKHSVRIIADVALLAIAVIVAFGLRFDWQLSAGMLARLLAVLPYVVAIQYALLFLLNVPRIPWRYFSFRDARQLVGAFVWSSLALLSIRIWLPRLVPHHELAVYAVVPSSVIVLDALIAPLLTLGARFLRRAAAEDVKKSALGARPDGVRTLLIGAGQGGLLTAREIARSPDLGIDAIGFVDDDSSKRGTLIHGVPVLGPTEDIASIAQRYRAEQVLITIAHAHGGAIRRIREACVSAGLRVKIVPGIHEIVGGTVNLSSIRDVAIDDLLRRSPIALDESSLSEALEGTVILVTGAGGSIGSELCRQVLRFSPAKLILLDHAENSLFNIHRELRDHGGTTELVPVVASVTNPNRMREIFALYRPQVVLHAAAYKHVPMMECNASQAIGNNVLGTQVVADLAHEFRCREFVLVSTDKAVKPSSVMGASKRAAEIYVQALAQRSETRFITVRFGNVLGSAGSVVPIFKEQIARGGPVTVTDPRMTRYFMTIPEASQLILQAARLGNGGEIFILDMGEPVKIVDLANDLIRLSGLTPGEDMKVIFSGIRPGEKLHEELWDRTEATTATKHPKILIGSAAIVPWQKVYAWFERARRLSAEPSDDWVRPMLAELVSEMPSEDAVHEHPSRHLVLQAQR
jgi:FlaA1/EpsC-like NDP-sugar epimerase